MDFLQSLYPDNDWIYKSVNFSVILRIEMRDDDEKRF